MFFVGKFCKCIYTHPVNLQVDFKAIYSSFYGSKLISASYRGIHKNLKSKHSSLIIEDNMGAIIYCARLCTIFVSPSYCVTFFLILLL